MTVGVYGLGRFGRFWAEFLSQHGFDVMVHNRSQFQAPKGTRALSLQSICTLDTLFLCTSISSMPDVVAQIAPFLSPKTLVMDTCSVKVFPLEVLRDGLAPHQAILGLHPMFGPDSSMVKQLPIVLCPQGIEQGSLDIWSKSFTNMGLSVRIMKADEHDREVARTQGITHFIGRFLASLNLKRSDIGTLGFQKLFEVMEQTCNDPWQLFLDLQKFNPHTPKIRQEMTEKFSSMIKVLDEGIRTGSRNL